jgi:DNA-binding FrmR family transcriptional regulator
VYRFFKKKARKNMPIGTAVNAGLGLLLQGYNDRRQVKQEGKLLQQQQKFDFQKMDKNLDQQLKLWEATNYAAQVEQMKKGGLSPGLMYGLGGGGGTTAAASASGVQGGKAPAGQNEIMGLQMLNAQKDLMKAQTDKTKAEKDKISGVDTAEAQTRIQSLTQGIKNQKATERLTRIQGDIGEIETLVQEGSYEDVINTIRYTAGQAEKTLGIMSNDKEISDATKKNKIDLVEGELIGLGIANELKRVQTRIQSLTQGIKNQKATERLTRIQGDIGEIETLVQEGS